MNYQSYNKENFYKEFSNSKFFWQISKDYKYLFSDIEDINIPVREDSHRVNLEKNSIFLYSLCYYLNFLLEKNPTTVADVGCGANIFKRYIPNLVGFDKTPEADMQEYFNEDFINVHREEFDSAFAVNSLNYISFLDLGKQLNDFSKIIKKGGRGFVTFNLLQLKIHTELHDFPKVFDLSKPIAAKEYEEYILKQLNNFPHKILVLDILVRENVQEKEYNSVKGSSWPTYSEFIHNAALGKIPENVLKEIKEYNIDSYDTIKLADAYNGNLRIVFEV